MHKIPEPLQTKQYTGDKEEPDQQEKNYAYTVGEPKPQLKPDSEKINKEMKALSVEHKCLMWDFLEHKSY